jgi:hypothetical protein
MTTVNPRNEVRCTRCGFRALLPTDAAEPLLTEWHELDVLDSGDGIDLHRRAMPHADSLELGPWRSRGA